MQKVTILSLHLGYGGAERCIINLANRIQVNTIYFLNYFANYYLNIFQSNIFHFHF